MTTRYELLVRLLTAFYYPGWQSSHMDAILALSQKVIVYQLDAPQSYLEHAIAGTMLHKWEQSRGSHGSRNARGSKKDALEASERYARFFYRVIFLDLAQGIRSKLNQKSWFESLSGACTFINAQLKQESPLIQLDENSSSTLDLIQTPAPDGPSLFEKLIELQLTWVQPHTTNHAELVISVDQIRRTLMQDSSPSSEECKEHCVGVLLDYWKHVKSSYPWQAHGKQSEALEHIRAFVEFWYEQYFHQRLHDSRASLSHDFPVFADGYAFVLLQHLYQQKEIHQIEEENEMSAVPENDGEN